MLRNKDPLPRISDFNTTQNFGFFINIFHQFLDISCNSTSAHAEILTLLSIATSEMPS